MKIVRKDIDNLNASLTITIEKGDYDKKFKSELNKYKDKVQMKGFRKGKTPTSVINKLYGKSILADTINKVLQESLSNHWGKMMFQWVYWNLLMKGLELPLEPQMNIAGKIRKTAA